MFKKRLDPHSLCLSGIIAALYATLTLLLAPISFGTVQCRVAEAMALLPMLMPQAISGLFVGCFIANLYTGSALDILFGSLATLIAAGGTYALRKKPLLAAACPILVNGVIVGAVLHFSQGLPYWLTAGQVTLGEGLAVLLGGVLLSALKRSNVHQRRK